jgi:arylsulfatase A-like enzyme
MCAPHHKQQAGYQTAIVGKWHLFTEPTGFDFFSVLPGHGRYFDSPFKETGQPWGANGNQGGAIRKGYVTDMITDIALGWLERRAADQPFCLMLHHKAPHSPHDPAPRHKNLFKEVVFPEPPNLLDDYAGRAPQGVADQLIWSRLLQQ